MNIQASFTLSEDFSNGSSKVIGDMDYVWIKEGEKFLAIDDHYYS